MTQSGTCPGISVLTVRWRAKIKKNQDKKYKYNRIICNIECGDRKNSLSHRSTEGQTKTAALWATKMFVCYFESSSDSAKDTEKELRHKKGDSAPVTVAWWAVKGSMWSTPHVSVWPGEEEEREQNKDELLHKNRKRRTVTSRNNHFKHTRLQTWEEFRVWRWQEWDAKNHGNQTRSLKRTDWNVYFYWLE